MNCEILSDRERDAQSPASTFEKFNKTVLTFTLFSWRSQFGSLVIRLSQ
jgi:hypothetical protein